MRELLLSPFSPSLPRYLAAYLYRAAARAYKYEENTTCFLSLTTYTFSLVVPLSLDFIQRALSLLRRKEQTRESGNNLLHFHYPLRHTKTLFVALLFTPVTDIQDGLKKKEFYSC